MEDLAGTVRDLVLRNKVEDLKKFLENYGAEEMKELINYRLPSCHGRTSVHLAAGNDLYDCLELLLKNGGNPNAKSFPPDLSRTPLHLAAKKDYSRCVWLLLTHKASLQVKDEDKYTVNDYMARSPKCKQVLMEFNQMMASQKQARRQQGGEQQPKERSKSLAEPKPKHSQTSNPPLPPEEKTLSSSDHHQVTQFLNELSNEQLRSVGSALGLHYPTLQRMNDLLGEMVAAWLRKDNDVSKHSGQPSWKSLVKALEEVGHRGIADQIRKSKFSTRRNSNGQNPRNGKDEHTEGGSSNRERVASPHIHQLQPSQKHKHSSSPAKRNGEPLPTAKRDEDEADLPGDVQMRNAVPSSTNQSEVLSSAPEKVSSKRDEVPENKVLKDPPTKELPQLSPLPEKVPSPAIDHQEFLKKEERTLGPLECLKQHRITLQKAATLDLTWLAHEMNAKGLLSDTTHSEVTDPHSSLSKDQKAAEMVGALETFVTINSQNLHKFVDILEQKPYYKDIIELLNEK